MLGIILIYTILLIYLINEGNAIVGLLNHDLF
jgi:hypothetical protein